VDGRTPSLDRAARQNAAGAANKTATVDLDELEKNPQKFLGKTVTVEGEVGRVLGPNLFTVNQRKWIVLNREVPVVVPETFTAIVRTQAPVRITGTVEKVPIARIERQGIATDPKIKAEIEAKPALVASEVTMIAPAAVAVNLLVRRDAPVGTSGTSANNNSNAVTDSNQVARSRDSSLVGRPVNIEGTVGSPTDQGFWISTPSGERIFVMPAQKTNVKQGQTATVQGVVLELPEGLRVQLNGGQRIYIYADKVATR
jgi:hypothetical protein